MEVLRLQIISIKGFLTRVLKKTKTMTSKILLAIVASAFSMCVYAQNEGANDIIDLQEVTISANRFAEPRADVPNQIESITAKEIQFQNTQNTADLLERTGQVMAQRSQAGGGSPILRGFEANKVLIVVDGVRMNNAIFRGGHLQNVLRIDQSMLDRAEIVFGPGSVVYGSDALGGAMCFYSKKPMLALPEQNINLKGNAFVRYGSANQEKTGHIDFNIGGKKFGSLSSFTFSDFGDMRQGGSDNPFSDYPDQFLRTVYVERINDKDSVMVNKDPLIQKQSGYKQYDLLQKFSFRQSENVSHTLNLQYSTTSDVPRYDRLVEVGGNGIPKSAEWYYGPESRLLAAYHLDLSNGTSFYDKLQLVAAYQNIGESRNSRKLNNLKRKSQSENVQVMSLNIDIAKQLNSKNELTYGVEATHNIVESTATFTNIVTNEETPADTRYADGGSNTNSLAAYATDRFEVSDKFVVSGGLRYSYNTLLSKFKSQEFFAFPFEQAEQKSGALSGNLGIVYKPSSKIWFSLLGSTGYRTPNVDDLSKVFESTGDVLIVPNPDLKPEYAKNIEAGISWKPSSFFQIELNGFYTLLDNALGTAAFKYNNQDSILYDGDLAAVYATQNLGSAKILGGYVGVLAPFGKGFSLYAKLNYTKGTVVTDTTDSPLDHIPPMFGRLGLQYQKNKVQAEVWAAYSAAKMLADYNIGGEDNLPSATPDGMPAWLTLNLRGSYQINKNFAVQAGVENLLDTNYRVFASGISSPGRNISVTLRAGF